MKVKVVNVVDTSFDGKDGTKVAACRLVYELDGKQRALDTYIPPVVTAALAWKPDQEVEIEEYQDKNGKTRFKTPQAGKGGGFKGLSYEERVKLDTAEQERMDTRTALMQAVAFHTASGPRDMGVLDTASKYLGWLREQRTPTAQSPPRAAGQDTGSATPSSDPVSPSVEAPPVGTKAGGTGQTLAAGSQAAKSRAAPEPPAASTSSSAGEDKHQGTVPAEASDAGAEGDLGKAPKAPASGYATDQQWARALMVMESKAAVLKAHAAKFGKSVPAPKITEAEMAELLAG